LRSGHHCSSGAVAPYVHTAFKEICVVQNLVGQLCPVWPRVHSSTADICSAGTLVAISDVTKLVKISIRRMRISTFKIRRIRIDIYFISRKVGLGQLNNSVFRCYFLKSIKSRIHISAM